MKSLNPNNLGLLVEECQKVKISDFLKKSRTGLREVIIKSELEVEGFHIELTTSKTGYNGVRFWFKCPLCNSRVGVLFRHPTSNAIGCRQCLRLEYRKRRYKGMIEGELPGTSEEKR
ncbi:hypothetical protein CO179_03770 [candidate division WWE3 bacterium CG_4_9_14_3_um_filter_39_7]|uniref:Uncharacterized protein n=1 Tax=candidate division WWE3 bacterium CG_4_9_14_3_um_filter_39_7 TaxID=1975080 RepID=A0A2M7X1F5_UNCKA|nr:MAG: hypothetical protein CO179_03770 [candidate division WWE3 bacterium CG_4_9_14_3_um_filter_39_7]